MHYSQNKGLNPCLAAPFPLRQVVEASGVPRLPGVNPLFQVHYAWGWVGGAPPSFWAALPCVHRRIVCVMNGPVLFAAVSCQHRMT